MRVQMRGGSRGSCGRRRGCGIGSREARSGGSGGGGGSGGRADGGRGVECAGWEREASCIWSVDAMMMTWRVRRMVLCRFVGCCVVACLLLQYLRSEWMFSL